MRTSHPCIFFHRLVHKAKPCVRSLALAVLLPCAIAHAQFEMEKIGDPIWEPRGYTMTSFQIPQHSGHSRIQNQRRFTSELLGDAHLARENFEEGGLPGAPHDGPYDREFSLAVAAAGGIDTDVFLLNEIRDPGTVLMLTTIIPSEGGPTGPSVDHEDGPILPEEIYPMEYAIASIMNDGVEELTCENCTAEFPTLSDYGVVVDEHGEEHDYTGLHWTHDFTTFGYTNLRSEPISKVLGDYQIVDQYRDAKGNGWDVKYSFSVVRRDTDVAGDLSYDEKLDMHDLNILTRNVGFGAINLRLDMNGDEQVNVEDVHFWVTDLKNTWIGDANLDGEFNSADFIEVFQAGKYETAESARWNEGDWNGDELFDSGDFIAAFQDGGYEMGVRVAVAAVPEPSGCVMLTLGMLSAGRFRRHRVLLSTNPNPARRR